MPETIKFYRSTGKHGFLSNLYPCELFFEEIKFGSSEHAYQYGKAKDPRIKEYIRAAPSPAVACIVGHGLFPWMVVLGWNNMRVDRMEEVLFQKFCQNKDLAEKLMATRNAILVETSKTDGFWGTGRKGKGRNMLGTLLMDLRDCIVQG